ncbi:L,D-transpeptidase family protein [Moellerella wisconsensis]|uniref:Murein L,D-transpeptidase n=1 Tax=Moellerella wisconsensis TaxID=158849 RepID=A0ACD3Y9H7_9GAMM|nr:murein L,D-transpeptidase family protein [Moellerella wisconsensis]KLN97505.1 lipoprotein [Moellerella wisconsensis]UNH27917.1 murein L,D-transpeptidase [Moellerella wisconsensis]UNH39529.1 murein L,D-transpeptidase [Moellerella wisconsensis]
MKKVQFFSLIYFFILYPLQLVYAENNFSTLKLNASNTQNNSVFIQVFKEENQLELYQKQQNGQFSLLKIYPICNYSGGLGPKKQPGDLKSPEGFYQITMTQLNPNSRYYRSINLGFPNAFDTAQGYDGQYLMIHGDCVSVGCYAMTDQAMGEIYHYTAAALKHGQSHIDINIYPFKMTAENMARHRNSPHYNFWQQLKPAYDYFIATKRPAVISVQAGQYKIEKDSVDEDNMTKNKNPHPQSTATKLLHLGSQNTFTEIK